MKDKFNPLEWLTTPESNNNKEFTNLNTYQNENEKIIKDVETVIERINIQKTDITRTYNHWRDIAFALVDHFGTNGREYFHRISSHHPEYSITECDKQFDKCLSSSNSGITIKTFFHIAKEYGIDIAIPNPLKQSESIQYQPPQNNTDKFKSLPESIYSNLPDFLHRICQMTDTSHEKDILLLGSLATISGVIPKVHGIYDNRKVFPNLFLFLTAKASGGKGILNHCRELAKSLHKELKDENQALKEEYNRQMNIYNANKKKQPDIEKPTPPPTKLLFIPANSSATGVFQLLSDNDGKGIIFETEGDTLSNTFKSDYGNYSDGFRKAFHHESISYYRRTDKEYAEIEKPRLSAILSGTPNQILTLIPDAENGLFSRFMFYHVDIKSQWKNVFEIKSDNGLDEVFEQFGRELHEFYKLLKQNHAIKFNLSIDQQIKFNQTFEKLQNQYHSLLGDEYIATVRRLGLITYRIAMTLSVLRIMDDGVMDLKIECSNNDFNTALTITKTLLTHAQQIFMDFPGKQTIQKPPNRKENFYINLPVEFSRQDYIKVASGLSIPTKSAEGYITNFVKDGLIHREKNGSYIKLLNQDSKE